MKLITDQKELVKLIEGIASRGKRLDSDIHLAGLSCLAHLDKHGDIGQVNRLYLALGKGARKAALTSWFLAYGSVVANDDKATKTEAPFKFTKEKATNVEGAMADPWYDHKPDQAPDEVFDLMKAVEQIIKKAAGKQLVHGEILTGLQGLVAMLHAPEGVTTSSVTDGEDAE